MKILSTFLALFLTGCAAVAQVPSFKSFNTNQFSTNDFIVSLKDGVLVTNINSIDTINLNGTNIVNLFAPLSLVTNNLLWTNIMDVLQPTAGTSVLMTNTTTIDLATIFGAFQIPPTTITNLVTGTNCLDTFLESAMYLIGPTTDPADTTISMNFGNGPGQYMTLINFATNSAFTMLNGEPFCDGSPDHYIRLNGDWISTNRGDGLLLYGTDTTWTEIGRFSANTNIISGDNVWVNESGHIHPVHGNPNNVLTFTSGLEDNATNVAMVVNTTNLWSASGSLLAAFQNAGTNNLTISPYGGIAVGRFATDPGYFGPLSDSDSFVAIHIPSLGDNQENRHFLATVGTNYNTSSQIVSVTGFVGGDEAFPQNETEWQSNGALENIWRISGDQTGSEFIYLADGTPRTHFLPDVTSTGSAVAYLIDTSNTLTNGDTFVSIGNAGTPIFKFAPGPASNPAGQITFGPGTTNVLYRSGNSLIYTNGATSTVMGFTLINGNGTPASISVTSSGQFFLNSDTGKNVVMSQSGGIDLNYTGSTLVPNGTHPFFNLGNGDNDFRNFYLNDNIYWNGTTNSLKDTWGTATPEGAETARPGSLFRETASGTIYVKTTGTGNTGWKQLQVGAPDYLDSTETNDTTTPQNISLTASVFTGIKYVFTMILFVDNSTTADGVAIDFDGGSATMTDFRAQGKIYTTAGLVESVQVTALATDISAGTLNGPGSVEVSGAFIPSGDGTFIPRAFMASDTTGTLSVFQGSNLVVTQAQ